jgi:hypothetical protein
MRSLHDPQDSGRRTHAPPGDHTPRKARGPEPAHGQGTSTYAGKRRQRRRQAQQQAQANRAAAIEASHTEALAANPQPPTRANRQRPAPARRLASAGPVTVTKVDGTTTTRPAYSPGQLQRIVGAETDTERQAQRALVQKNRPKPGRISPHRS